MMWNYWDPRLAPQTLMRHIISLSLQKFCITSPKLQFFSWWRRKWKGSESIQVFFLLTSGTSKLVKMAFVYLVDFPLRGIYVMSLGQWDAASAPCHLFIWIIDLSELINILWVIWVRSCALQCTHESRCLVKILTRGVFHMVSKPHAKSFVQASFMSTKQSAHVRKPLESRVHI